MRIVITFLGLFPKLTEYQHQGSIYKGEVFAQALCQFCQFDRMLVCVTPEAKANTLPILTGLNDPRIETVEIPKGETTTEMWKTFTTIAQQVKPGDEVIFDITHGLRSLPFLVFLAAAYLKAAKNATIEAIYYGAFDLKDDKGIAPVIDLSPLVSLLDWTTATDQFIKTGNAQALAILLEREGDAAAEKLAQGVNAIAEGLHLLRPYTVMQQAAKLPTLIQSASSTISQSVPPFAALSEQVQQDYAKFGLENPAGDQLNAQAALVCQLKMIEWYTEKGQTVQALSMAREWLPSLLCFRFELDPLDKTNRSEMEFLLATGGKPKDQKTGKIKESPYLKQWEEIPGEKRKPISRLWNGDPSLANLRNDVLHSGFRKNPKPPQVILEQTEQIVKELKAIARLWGLEE
jgi:CRISPR-associated DxTHG motif protein